MSRKAIQHDSRLLKFTETCLFCDIPYDLSWKNGPCAIEKMCILHMLDIMS